MTCVETFALYLSKITQRTCYDHLQWW